MAASWMSNRHYIRLWRYGLAAMLLLLATAVAAGEAVAADYAAGLAVAESAQTGPSAPRRIGADILQGDYALTGEWRFQPGDDLSWAMPEYDDGHWRGKRVPERWPDGGYPATGQMAWYRMTLELDLQASDFERQVPVLAVRTGQVMSAFELYAGGQRIGAIGSLPPAPSEQYDRMRVFHVPATAISENGRLVLALRVWGGHQEMVDYWYGGPYYGQFRIGQYSQLMQGMIVSETPGQIAVVLFLAFGLYQIYLYYRNRQLGSYLWFGLLALNIGVYSLCLGQWKYLLGWDFLTYEKLEYASMQILPALAMQMVFVVLQRPVGPLLRVYQLSFVLFATVVLLVPGLRIHYLDTARCGICRCCRPCATGPGY